MPARAFGYRITLAEAGPVYDADFQRATPVERAMVLNWLVIYGLKEKDADLAAGLDREGTPLTPVSPATAKYRHSAMGPADPSAPALMPAYGVSRTRLLLTGEAGPDYAEFFWLYDPHTGDTWGQILDYQRHGVGSRRVKRDVIGISPQAVARVRSAVAAKWQAYKRNAVTGRVDPAQPTPPPPRFRVIGKTNFEQFTYGIGGSGPAESRQALNAGYSTGFFQRKPGQGLPALGGPGTFGRPPGPPPRPPRPMPGIRPRPPAPVAPKAAQVPPPVVPKPQPQPAKPPRPKRAAPEGVTYVRAPAGGAFSDVTGKHYKGGQLMPIHGLSAGLPKSKPVDPGSGSGGPAKPTESGSKRTPYVPREPMTPEAVAAKAAEKVMWDEIRTGPLGQMLSLGENPHPVNRGIIAPKWIQWVEDTLGKMLGLTRAAAEDIAFQRLRADPQAAGMTDAEVMDVVRYNIETAADHPQSPIPKKHRKAFPESATAFVAANDVVPKAPIADLHKLNRAMTPPDETP